MPEGLYNLGPSSPIASQPMRDIFTMPQPKKTGFLQGLSEFFFGAPGKMEQVPNYSPMQQMVLNQLLGQAAGQMDFSPIEQSARRGFTQTTIPSIAERFSMMGSEGGQRSSAFAQALGGAGADLESQLANMKQGRLLQMLQLGLTPQTSAMYNPSSPGFLQAMAPGIGMGLSSGLGMGIPGLFGVKQAVGGK